MDVEQPEERSVQRQTPPCHRVAYLYQHSLHWTELRAGQWVLLASQRTEFRADQRAEPRTQLLVDRRIANQGIHHSLRNSLITGIIEGPIIGCIGTLIYPLNTGLTFALSIGLSAALNGQPIYGLSDVLDFGLSNAPSVGLATAISGALLTCILTGGLAVWRHYVIRFLLWRSRTFSWQAPQFLDDATARFLLRRVAGGYSFSHRLLLDHLADATEESTELP
jgi:hypothetical protein